jgi:serine/threonine-protein kinase SRPK3
VRYSDQIQVWDLFEYHHLFKGRNPKDDLLDDSYHLAEMVAILGTPPIEFLNRSERSRAYWDEEGRFSHVG